MIAGGREQSQMVESNQMWREEIAGGGDCMWKGAISGGGELSQVEGSVSRWMGVTAGGEEISQV